MGFFFFAVGIGVGAAYAQDIPGNNNKGVGPGPAPAKTPIAQKAGDTVSIAAASAVAGATFTNPTSIKIAMICGFALGIVARGTIPKFFD